MSDPIPEVPREHLRCIFCRELCGSTIVLVNLQPNLASYAHLKCALMEAFVRVKEATT